MKLKRQSQPKTRGLFTSSRVIKRFGMPAEAEAILKEQVRKMRRFYANEREYIESVVAYSLWCGRDHHLTGPSFRSKEDRDKMWQEVIADYGRKDNAGSFFEHRMEEMMRARASIPSPLSPPKTMKKAIIVPVIAIAALFISAAPTQPTKDGKHPNLTATCKGSYPCRACSTCEYCKHCSVNGGSCGACS